MQFWVDFCGEDLIVSSNNCSIFSDNSHCFRVKLSSTQGHSSGASYRQGIVSGPSKNIYRLI
jgi:hypothetical protein